MKLKSPFLFNTLSVFVLVLLANACTTPSQQNKPLAYLGETPPGNEPVVFAPGVVSVANRFDLGISFSPDGHTIAFGVAHESDTTQRMLYFMNDTEGKWSAPDASLLPGNQNTFFPIYLRYHS